MSAPKISILCPSFNHERFIEACIESILNQTFKEFELIIVDDASSDDNVKKIETFKDERIKLVKHSFNKGINASLSTAFLNSNKNSELVIFLAGDDMLVPNALELIYKTFASQNVIALYNKMITCDVNGEIKKQRLKERLKIKRKKINENFNRYEILHTIFMKGNCLMSPGLTMKRKTFEELLYPLDFAMCNHQDTQINIKLLLAGEIYIMQEPLILYKFDEEVGNISYPSTITTAREELEIDSLMDTFLECKDLTLLEKIFANEIQQSKIKPFKQTIEFFLGKMAILSENKARKIWGYHKIMNSYKTSQETLKELYEFEFKDYLKLANSLSEDKIYKKYKKYKKAFNISLYFICLMLVVCVSIFILGMLL